MLATTIKNISLSSILAWLSTSRARWSLTALLSAASLLTLVLIAQLLFSVPPQVASADSLAVANSTSSNPRWNWFPVVREVVEPEVDENEELARATIKAELLGVVISADNAYAAISTTKNPDGLYSVGDSIENNVTLEEIQDYRVVISQRGSRRQIPLKSLDTSRSANTERASLIEVGSSTSSGFNLSGLMSTTPVQIPGGGIGLKLGGLSEDLTDLADVQDGDIVLAVNGMGVSKMMSNPLLWQEFSQQTSMPITILRGEDEIELFVNAASLSEKILPRIGAGQVN